MLEEEVSQLEKNVQEEQKQYEVLSKEAERFDAKESSHIKEIKHLKKEIENVVTIKNQEIQSLKFQLSTLEMKHDIIRNVSAVSI